MIELTRFDVASAASAGADLHLRHPSTLEPLFADGKPATIRLLGRDAPAVRDAARAADRAVTAGEIDSDERLTRVLVAATVGWSGIAVEGDEEYSPEAARKLYTMPEADWVLEQITPFFMDRANYARNMLTD